jgi:hypothetical protein
MTISRRSIALLTLAIALGVSGCERQPVAAVTADVGASFNGLVLGSGNRAGADTTAVSTASTTSASGDSAESGRNGLVLGSGN